MAQIAVGDEAPVLLTEGDTDRLAATTVLITNTGSDGVEIGGADLTFGEGYTLAAGASLPPLQIAANQRLYAICDESETATVNVLSF